MVEVRDRFGCGAGLEENVAGVSVFEYPWSYLLFLRALRALRAALRLFFFVFAVAFLAAGGGSLSEGR